MTKTASAKMPLNAGQQAAADTFYRFLLSDDVELNISGPGGVGKTFLMSHLITDVMLRYEETCDLMGIKKLYTEVVVTATTNKAAEVLHIATGQPARTIHSFLNLKVRDDYSTGRSILSKTENWQVHENIVLFIDEGSMIDSELYLMIHSGTLNCKIVYVGDHCQLAPVMEVVSPIYRRPMTRVELTEPVRNSGHKELVALCSQLRETVETGQFLPLFDAPGVIDFMDDTAMEAEIASQFSQNISDNRILAYTNQRVIDYNEHIRDLRMLPPNFQVGEALINTTAIRLSGEMLSVEQELIIKSINSASTMVQISDDVELEVHMADLETLSGFVFENVPIPADKEHYRELVKYYARAKNWERYFFLKNTYPDLRQRDASTVYKAQGSTHHTVFVDLNNISTCTKPAQTARMLYVAATRASDRVIFYGQLSEKYGGPPET